jgi:hypothetical protein
MEPTTCPVAPATVPQPATCQARCPLCSGPMTDQRGQWRCGRCFFVMCEGCGGAEPTISTDE